MPHPLAKLLSMLTPKRRWAQFSLATMFVVVTVLCVWMAIVVNRAHRQQDAVAAIEELGGEVEFEKPNQSRSEAFSRRFLRRWMPQDYFDDVHEVWLNGTRVTNDGLRHLRALTKLRLLLLDSNPEVTDAGLAQVRGLTRLQVLQLGGTQVTDSGLGHLRGLSELQELQLDGTRVTDGGLVHLQGATELRILSLDGTQVTDAGLIHLRGLTVLQELWLVGTLVTDEGVAELQKALPNCQILH
jgi:hypothetical protein